MAHSYLLGGATAGMRVRVAGPVGYDPDPAVVARSFHGSLIFYNFAGAIARVEPIPRDPKALAAAIVNLYLPGAPS